jgi:hypothetical protein
VGTPEPVISSEGIVECAKPMQGVQKVKNGLSARL